MRTATHTLASLTHPKLSKYVAPKHLRATNIPIHTNLSHIGHIGGFSLTCPHPMKLLHSNWILLE